MIKSLFKYVFVGIVLPFAVVAGILMSLVGFYAPDHPAGVKTAVVLGAAVYTDHPSPVFRERINHAINLYKKGRVTRIIFTGGRAQGDKISEAEAGKRYAIKMGIPATSILTEDLSKSTRENLLFACRVMQQYDIKKVVLVSDPLHLKRAVAIARDSGMPAWASGTPSTRYKSFSAKAKFLASEAWYYAGHLLRKTFSSVPKCYPPKINR